MEIPVSRGIFRDQGSLIAIFLYNLIYNLLPFWVIKNWYLRITGTSIGHKSYIHMPVRFTYPRKLKIGDHTTINFGCLLDTRQGIEIGTNVMVGHYCRIYSAGHDIDDEFFSGIDLKGGIVRIEDDAVIFPNVLIMPGVMIQKGAVVLPGSVVTRNVAPYNVVGGNPAQVIRQRSPKISYKLNYKGWFINS